MTAAELKAAADAVTPAQLLVLAREVVANAEADGDIFCRADGRCLKYGLALARAHLASAAAVRTRAAARGEVTP